MMDHEQFLMNQGIVRSAEQTPKRKNAQATKRPRLLSWLQFRRTFTRNNRQQTPVQLLSGLRSPSISDTDSETDSTDPPAPIFGQAVVFDIHAGLAATEAAARAAEAGVAQSPVAIGKEFLLPDSESGIGIGIERSDDVPTLTNLIRRDPVLVLPPELVAQIFVELDPETLRAAECVAKRWQKIALDNLIWRDIFRREFRRQLSNSSIPNRAGLGPADNTKCKDWKELWEIRATLENRWSDGHATAVHLDGHTDSVYCVQFDREKIVTGSRDRTVRVWSTQTYQCISVLGMIGSRVHRPSAPPAKASAVRGGQKPAVIVTPPFWLPPVEEELPFQHTGSILCLQYDDDNIVTGSSDKSIIIWQWDSIFHATPVARLIGHDMGVLDVCIDNMSIVSCSKDKTLRHWNIVTGELVGVMKGHTAPVNAVKIRDCFAVSVGGDSTARLWSLETHTCLRVYQSDSHGLACVDLGPNLSDIWAGGGDRIIYQFDAKTGHRQNEIMDHCSLVRTLHMDRSNNRLISGSYDGSVRAYDLEMKKAILNFPEWTSSWIFCARADYRRIVATSQDGRVVVMDFGHDIPRINWLEGWRYEDRATEV